MDILTVVDHHGHLVVDSRLVASELHIEQETLDELSFLIWNQPKRFFTAWDLLALWQRSAYEGFHLSNMCQVLNKIEASLSQSDVTTFSWLRTAVVAEIADTVRGTANEYGKVHKWFKQNAVAMIAGSTLADKVVPINRKRPDFLIYLEGQICPVECKLAFGKASLAQLKGYMKLWKSRYGFAVAPKLLCDLPSSIKYIKCP